MEKSLVVNAGANFFKTLINIIFPLITFPYATRILGVEHLGKVAYATTVISYFSLIATLGISIYAVREGSKYRDDFQKLSKFSKEILVINSISTAVAYFFFIIYLIIFSDPSLRSLLVISSFSIGFTTYSINWLYQIKEDFVYVTWRAFVIQLLSLILLFLFVKTPDDYIKYALIQVLGSSGSFTFNLIHARKYINLFKKYKLEISKHLVPVFTIFGISLASSIYMNLDLVMLGALVSTYAVGLYEAATKLAQVVKVLITSFSNVLIPRMSYYVANNKIKEFEILFKKCFNYIILLTVPLCVGMALLGQELILLVGGNNYVEATPAARILSINVLFSVIDGILYYQILLPFGLEKQATLCTVIGAIMNLVLNALIIPRYSFVGAACTTLASEFLVFLCLSHYSKGIIKKGDIFKIILQYIILCFPIGIYILIIKKLLSSFLAIIILSVLGGCIIYFIMLLVTKNPFLVELSAIINKNRKIFKE